MKTLELNRKEYKPGALVRRTAGPHPRALLLYSGTLPHSLTNLKVSIPISLNLSPLNSPSCPF